MSVISEILTFHEARRFTDQELAAYVAPSQSPSVFGLIGFAESYPGGSFSRVYPGIWTNDTTAPSLSEDLGKYWYNRIHLIPSATALGNLLSSQEVSIEVWNAFFTQQTLNDITEFGTEGMTIHEPAPTPLVYEPLESKAYTITIDVVGPPTIDGKVYFNFSVYTVTYSVTGKRVVVFPFVPNSDYTETLEWKTDLIKTKAAEQRIAMRNLPRQSLSYDYQLSDTQFSKAKTIMSGWTERSFSVPMWSDYESVGALTAGATNILVDTTTADYIVDGLALIFQDENNFEAVEIQTLNAASIDLKVALVNSYTNAVILPVLLANAINGMAYTRTPDSFISGQANFMSVVTNDLSGTNETQYKGIDIILNPSVYVSSISERITKEMRTLDSTIGRVIYDPSRSVVDHDQVISFDTLTKEELWSARQWIHSRRGKQKTFYIPTWNNDLNVVTDINAADTTITVTDIKYHLYYTTKDIIILKKDGTYVLLDTYAGSDNGDGTETISISTQVGEDILVSEIDKVSFVTLCRFNSDRIEIKHRVNRGASIVIPIVEVPA